MTTMRVVAGTSGFSYPEWRGRFYPEGLAESGMLRFYAEKLASVEINNTFYRMPKSSILENWARSVPEHFSFALKAPRRITHLSKLRNTTEAMGFFLASAQSLGSKLGPLLFQLPPFLKKDVPLLSEFLALVPDDVRAAFEFRHASWFGDDVYAALSERRAALCAAEVDADEGEGAPFVRTAPFSYVRLRKTTYDEASLDAAFARIAGLGVSEVFVYMKHEVEGPGYALQLLERAARHTPDASRPGD